jgi:predicted TIM-barrel fold metal-dependent hydrolase
MPLGSRAVKVYETARRLKVPLIVHTGAGAPLALPALMIKIAKKYPDLTIVLAHAGGFIYFDEALLAAEQCENIYLEMSWCGAPQLRAGLNSIGPGRIMFGSDGPLNVGPELAKAEALDLSDDVLEQYLGKTAIKVYNLKV